MLLPSVTGFGGTYGTAGGVVVVVLEFALLSAVFKFDSFVTSRKFVCGGLKHLSLVVIM